MNSSNIGQASTNQSSIASHNLGCRLLKAIASSKGAGNVFLSPFSISTALAIVYGGAIGETAQEFSQVAGFGAIPLLNQEYRQLINSIQNGFDSGEIRIANSLWADHQYSAQMNEQFVNQAVENYSASLYPVNFANPGTVDIVNNWISNATQGKIAKMLDDTTGIASLIINAIYFSGKWSLPFEKSATRIDKFYTTNGGAIDCTLMQQTDSLRYHEIDSNQTIFLPYKRKEGSNSSLAMAICLPKPGATLMSEFQFMENIFAIYDESTFNKVRLSLPRFSLTFGINLKDTLSSLGIVRAFDSNHAQFDNYFKGFYIDRILHKAALEVDETGTKAAAATVVQMAWGCAPDMSEPIVMEVNSPFLLAILDLRNKATLFLGGVTKPDPLGD